MSYIIISEKRFFKYVSLAVLVGATLVSIGIFLKPVNMILMALGIGSW